MASVVIIIFLLIERFVFLYPQMSKQDRINKKLFKNPETTLDSRSKRQYRKKPERILKKLSKDFQDIEQEVTTILSSGSIDALSSLSLLSNYIDKNKDVDLIEFQSDG